MLKAKLKMPVIQSKELFSFNNKLIEADEKFSILEKKKNPQTNQLFKNKQTKKPKTLLFHYRSFNKLS